MSIVFLALFGRGGMLCIFVSYVQLIPIVAMSDLRVPFKYSTACKCITVGTLLLIAAMAVGLYLDREEIYAVCAPSLIYSILLGVLLLGLLVVLGYYALRAPRYYILRAEGLYIKYVFGDVYYSAQDYEIVPGVSAEEIRGAVRTLGSGGYFGYVGRFYVPGRGSCTFCLTRRSGRLIRLTSRTSGRRVYVSE